MKEVRTTVKTDVDDSGRGQEDTLDQMYSNGRKSENLMIIHRKFNDYTQKLALEFNNRFFFLNG